MSATLKVTRKVSYRIELRRGQFEISLDGDDVGSLVKDETFETSIEPGHHTLRIRKGRYSSRNRSFDCAEGEVVTFNCHGASIWPMYVVSMAKPDVAISLKRS